MSKHLTVSETIELLDSLRDTVREFAAAEEKLNKEFRTRNDAAQKRFDEELAAHDAQATERLRDAERSFSTKHTAVIAWHERRKARHR